MLRGTTTTFLTAALLIAAACGKTSRDTAGSGTGVPAGTAGEGGGSGLVSCEGSITFADPRLEAAVREAIQHPDGEILTEHVSGLSELVAAERGISDLDGLQCFDALTALALYKNNISDLSPLSGLTRLSYLALDENGISDLAPLSGLKTLDYLILEHNTVSDVDPLSGLTELIWLTLGDNSISDLGALTGMTSLAVLDLGNNNVSGLDPLVANPGLDSDDYVYLLLNPIDCTEQAENIQALLDRGVDLSTDCP